MIYGPCHYGPAHPTKCKIPPLLGKEDFRLLVTGSRLYQESHQITHTFDELLPELPTDRRIVLVHGGARGFDSLAAALAKNRYGWAVEEHPANWLRYGSRQAGIRRNAHMVTLGADLCLAFPHPEGSGTQHCYNLAIRAGIPARSFMLWTIIDKLGNLEDIKWLK